MPDTDSNLATAGGAATSKPVSPPEIKPPSSPLPGAGRSSVPSSAGEVHPAYNPILSEVFPSPLPRSSSTKEELKPASPPPPPRKPFLPEESWSPPPQPKNEELNVPSPFSPETPPVEIPKDMASPPPSNSSPPYGVNITSPQSSILKSAMFLLGVIVMAVLGFAFWKFVLPLLPAGVKPGGVTITYWGLWEDETVIRPVIDAYEKSHRGVKVDYKKQNPSQYRERLQAAVEQGKGPDVFRFHNTWLPMLKNSLSPVPASVFSASDFQKTFYPVAVKDLGQGSSFYGVPLEFDGLSLLYNTDIFNAAGVSPPVSWEELQKDAILLTVKDENKRIQTAGVAMGTVGNVDSWSDILGLMFLQNGADLKNPQGKLAEDALTFYTSFSQGDNKTWDDTLPPSTLAFAQGKVAMIFAPSWQLLTIKDQNPKLNFKVLPVPQLPGVNINWASYWVEGVSQKSNHQSEAWDFLKYLSQKETLVNLYTQAAKTRLFGEPYSRQDLAASLKDDPYVGAYIQQANNAKTFYLASQTFDNGINDKIIKYFEDAVNSVNRGVSPKHALETAAKGVSQVLSTYGIVVTSPGSAAR